MEKGAAGSVPVGDVTGSRSDCPDDEDGMVDISQSVRRLQQRIAVMQRSLRPDNDIKDRYRTRPRGHDTADYVYKVTTGARNLVKTYALNLFIYLFILVKRAVLWPLSVH